MRQAIKAAVAILVILSLAALFGEKVLQTFGISLDAFKVAGGGVLAWMGFSMLRSGADSNKSQAKSDEVNPSLSPLIMFAASPGTITGVITLAVTHAKTSDFPLSTLIAIAVAVGVTLLVMIAISFAGGKQKRRVRSRHDNAVYGIDRDRDGRAIPADRIQKLHGVIGSAAAAN